jgi:hypothetical protein
MHGYRELYSFPPQEIGDFEYLGTPRQREMQPHLIPNLATNDQVAYREGKHAILQEHNIVQPKKDRLSI